MGRGQEIIENTTVAWNREIGPGLWWMSLDAPRLLSASPPGPGQFLHILPGPGSELFMRRPISVLDLDRGHGRIELYVQVFGPGSRLIAASRPGDRLDCLGSHGRLDIYDFLCEQARELERQPEIRPPLLTGEDLIALGMKPGVEVDVSRVSLELGDVVILCSDGLSSMVPDPRIAEILRGVHGEQRARRAGDGFKFARQLGGVSGFRGDLRGSQQVFGLAVKGRPILRRHGMEGPA